jgi:hypothetical protein
VVDDAEKLEVVTLAALGIVKELLVVVGVRIFDGTDT